MKFIIVKCDNCKKHFRQEKSLFDLTIKRKYKHHFCSSKCKDKYYTKKRINLNCLNCGKSIKIIESDYKKSTTKKFFCRQSCAAIYNNKLRTKKNLKPFPNFKKKKIKLYLCKFCGKQSKKEFCSKLCQNFFIIETTGDATLTKNEEHNRRIAKKYLIKTEGHICKICHNTEWLGKPIPLILDHIDGNALNYKTLNLRTVCGNCNMMLPTFAGRNRGKGKRSKVPRH